MHIKQQAIIFNKTTLNFKHELPNIIIDIHIYLLGKERKSQLILECQAINIKRIIKLNLKMKGAMNISQRIERIRSYGADYNQKISTAQDQLLNQLNQHTYQLHRYNEAFHNQQRINQETESAVQNRKLSIRKQKQQLQVWNKTKSDVLKKHLQTNRTMQAFYEQSIAFDRQNQKIEDNILVLNSVIAENISEGNEMSKNGSGINNSLIQQGNHQMNAHLNPQTKTIKLTIQRGRQLGQKLEFKLRYIDQMGKFVPLQQYSTIITKIMLNYNFHRDLAKLQQDLDKVINQN